MNIKVLSISLFLATISRSSFAQNYFIPHLKKGQKLADIYSRTIAVSGEGFAPLINRVSGTSYYTVTDNDSNAPAFAETDIYDGHKPYEGNVRIGLNGENVYNGKTAKNTNASGLLYNAIFWGDAHRKIKTGDTWQVKIDTAWELGGIGIQKVEVLSIDKKNRTVMLKREGDGEGFFDSERKQMPITTTDGKKLTADVLPGKSHWIGYTIFKEGVVISDELMVTRPLKLTAEGLSFDAQQREYILLNAMPVE